MELTIAKILFTKEVQGQRGTQHNTRFTTNEMGEKSISGFFDAALKPGDKINGEVVDKPGTNREGQPVTYHNFQAARKQAAPSGDVMVFLNKIYTEVYAIRQEQVMIRQLLQKDGSIPSHEVPPVTAYATDPLAEEFDDIKPEDIPFD